MADTFELRIDSQAYGGDAVGRLADGRVVFVPYAIPGELVRVHILEDKAKYVRAEVVEVLEPSADRVTPRCQHFGTCGGCHYQHMAYPIQVNSKAQILKDQLERIGGFNELPEVEVKASPQAWNYRNTIQLHLTREGKLGYQKARTNQPFAICECHLPEPPLNDLWPSIDIEPQAGLERISLRVGLEEELMLVLESRDDRGLEFNIEGLPISVVQQAPSGNIILAGSDHLSMESYGRQFQVSAGSFFQVNRQQAEAMTSYLLENLPLNGVSVVVDAYCGVGLFSAFLAPKVTRLAGIEVSPEACEDFASNLDEFDHVELYEAPVENVLGTVAFHPDVIVMDPPRAGLGSKTVEGVLAQGAGHLAYISCDPATLARDAKQLAAGGYSLKKVTLFDMFPQTFHIESISLWVK